MSRYLGYDPVLLVDLRAAVDAAVWHLAATRFEHPYCEDWRASVLAIRARLEELRDTLLQPVIDSDAMAAAAHWNTLTDRERRDLITKRPDLAMHALVGGATFTSDELAQLESSNAYATFSEDFGVEIAAQVNLSSALSSIPSIIATYLANYFWTFQSSHDHLATLFRFVTISLVALLLNMAIMHLCVHVLGLWYIFGALITVVVVATTNFLLHVYWSFRPLEG